MSPTPVQPVRIMHLLPDFDLGGGQVILLRTIEAMDDGFEHLVVGLGEGPMLEQYRDAGVRCEIVPVGGIGTYPGVVARLVGMVKRERVDVLLNLNTPLDRTLGQIVALVTRRPFVIWFMSIAIPRLSFPPRPSRALAWAKRSAMWPFNVWSVRRAAARLSLSNAVSRSFADHLRLPVEAFDLVRPGLDAEVFERQIDPGAAIALRERLGVVDADPLLLSVGMLIDLKGQQELVPMMELIADDLPDAHLLLVGEGENRATLEAEISRRGLSDRVTLAGHRSDVPDLLGVADGFLSASRSEGFGMAVLEAMAAGLPVVAVRLPAIEEFAVDGSSAILVDAQDATMLASGVVETFGDRDVAASMGATGRELAAPRTRQATAEAAGAVIGRVATAGPSRSAGRSWRSAGKTVRRRIGGMLPVGSKSELVVASGPAAGLRMGTRNASSDYADGTNELPVQEAIAGLVKPGTVFHDIGANIGFFSLIAARRVGPDGRVVAFEPLADNVECIRDNAERNGFGNIEIHEVALTDRSGPVELLVAEHPGGSTIAPDSAPPDLRGRESVTGVTLDELISSGAVPEPDVVKIDVEGAEPQVLAGMTDTIARTRPVLVCEFDDESAQRCDEKREAFESMITEMGYDVRRLRPSYDGAGWQVAHVVATPR